MQWLQELRREDTRRERAEMLQLHRERVARVNRPAMWRELMRLVGIHVAMLQSRAGSAIDMTVDPEGQFFVIRKSNFPCVKVDCRFLDERRIEIRFSYLRTADAENASTRTTARNVT